MNPISFRRFDWSKVDHSRLIAELPALKLIAELEAILSEILKKKLFGEAISYLPGDALDDASLSIEAISLG